MSLALPPTASPGSATGRSFTLAADADLTIRDGATETPAHAFATVGFDVTGGKAVGGDALVAQLTLGRLALTCEPKPGLLAPCYGDLVAEMAGRADALNGELTRLFTAKFDDIVLGKRVGTADTMADFKIQRAAVHASAAGHTALLRVDLYGALVWQQRADLPAPPRSRSVGARILRPMPKPLRREIYRTGDYAIHILGAPRPGLRDLYHAMLRVPWWGAFLVIVGGYLALNFIFALLYLAVGGVANAHPGSLLHAFFFSVETMGTIGYGSMHPTSTAAHVLVVAESVTGLMVTALATGLVFARFSQTRARLLFSTHAAIGPMDGVPTLMVRIGNERRGNIVGASFRMTFARTQLTAEGVTMYRMRDLPLVHSRASALSRAWMVLHRIGEDSPLHGYDAAQFAAVDGEISLEVAGLDDTSLQPVHASHTWFPGTVAWDSRLDDVLSETADGDMVLDLTKFHDVVPNAPADPSPPTAR